MVIYADVVFLVNFVFDLLILIAMLRLLSRKIRPVRIIFAAVLGGGFAVAVLIPYLQPLLSAVSRYLLPFFMSGICFMPCSARTLIYGGISIYAMSFLFAGIMEFFGVYALFGVLVLIPIVALFSHLRHRLLKRYKRTILNYHGNRVSYDGFSDSGNLLNCNGMPVILAKQRVFEKLFGTGFCIGAITEWVDNDDIRIIPYKTLGKSGIITGVVLDCASVDGRVYDKVVLGYFCGDFSEQLILSGDMV